MRFLPSIFSAPEIKKSQAWSLHYTGMNPVKWFSRDYRAFAKEAYQMNVIAYSAINRIATAVSSIEWQVRLPSGDITDNHPYLDLIKRPNPAQSGIEWWKTRVSYLLLSGNLYDERVDNARAVPQELWPLRPDRTRVKEGQAGLPQAYIYTHGSNKVVFDVDQITGEGPIRHTKLFNPLDDWYGMSPVEAAVYAVDQHNESMTWVQALLQNSARPSGALVMDKEVSLSDEEFNRLKAEVEEKHSGAANTGRPMLLEGGLDWKAMGLSPEDMSILRTKDSAARDISLTFGVPPLLLNIPGDNTYANYREARLGFYEDTILPFVDYQATELNDWLSSSFGGALIEPNKDRIEAIADKKMKQWEMADNSDDITLNESRKIKGLPALPDPLGSMLMVQVRAMARNDGSENPDQEDLQEELKEMVYGRFS